MKKSSCFRFLLVTLILCGCLFGCAKTATVPADEQSQVGATDVSQQPDVAGVGEQQIQEQGIAEHQAVSGLQRIHFDFDQSTLSPEGRAVLADNATYLKAISGLQVVIEGHCDERGSDEYNLALGESRALAAKNYLVSAGISASRLSVISYGEEKPLDRQANEEAWAMNRRAEFKAVR